MNYLVSCLFKTRAFPFSAIRTMALVGRMHLLQCSSTVSSPGFPPAGGKKASGVSPYLPIPFQFVSVQQINEMKKWFYTIHRGT